MMIVLPNWYTEAEKRLNRIIIDIAIKNNIKFSFVQDSRTIEKSVRAILITLVNIQRNAHPEIDKKQFKRFKKVIKDEKETPTKG